MLTLEEYRQLTSDMIAQGLVDVVIPGMEPLLRAETWAILDQADQSGARSIGITSNGTLLEANADRLSESALSVLNISVDGPSSIHDSTRGNGVFNRVDRGINRFRKISSQKLITNTTVTTLNHEALLEIATIGLDWGVTYSAFHPFEHADEAEVELGLTPAVVADAYEDLVAAFKNGQLGSIIIEAEASTLDVILILAKRGVLNDFALVRDEANFLFLRLASGDHEMLVNLMFYPHHFIRTIRVADNGGISSCRAMARTGWSGLGDLRAHCLIDHLERSDVHGALTYIWREFRAAVRRAGDEALEAYIILLQSKTRQLRYSVPRPARLAHYA